MYAGHRQDHAGCASQKHQYPCGSRQGHPPRLCSPLSMRVIELYFFSPLKLDKAMWLVLSNEIWVNIHLFCLQAFWYSCRLSHIPFPWPWLLTTLQTVGAISSGGSVRTKLQFPASPSKLPKRSQKQTLAILSHWQFGIMCYHCIYWWYNHFIDENGINAQGLIYLLKPR